MNDAEMRGVARADEVITALEKTYTGLDLLGALLVERDQARDQSDELRMQARMYNAAYRRNEEKNAA